MLGSTPTSIVNSLRERHSNLRQTLLYNGSHANQRERMPEDAAVICQTNSLRHTTHWRLGHNHCSLRLFSSLSACVRSKSVKSLALEWLFRLAKSRQVHPLLRLRLNRSVRGNRIGKGGVGPIESQQEGCTAQAFNCSRLSHCKSINAGLCYLISFAKR